MTRRFLMNMMVGAAAMTAAAEINFAEASADIVAEAGAQFERLIVEYVDHLLETARLYRAARAAHRENFGAHRDDNLTSEGRARWAALEEMFASNGHDQVSQKSCDLYEVMTPLAEKIKGAPVAGMADLRARTLVSLWEALPSDMYNEGSLNFYSEYDGGAIRSMFVAAVTLTGLQPLVSEIEQRLAAGAACDPGYDAPADAAPAQDQINPEMIRIEDAINNAADEHRECYDATTDARKAVQKWKKRNPRPMVDDADADGFSLNAKARSNHTDREVGVMTRVRLGPTHKAYLDARARLDESVRALAGIRSTNMEEVLFKADIAFCRDIEGKLSKSVTADLLIIQRPNQPLRHVN
jgi:hypothetical protein